MRARGTVRSVTERPDYWDDLDPEFRALLEAIDEEEPPAIQYGSPEWEAKMASAKKNIEEYEREFGPFTEEEIAEAERIVEQSLAPRPAKRNTKRSA